MLRSEDRSTSTSTSRRGRRLAALVTAAALLVGLAPQPADAAGLSLPVAFGQRFLGSASPAKSMIIPLRSEIGPIKPLAIAGIQGATFAPIKDPVLGITIFSSSEVKQIVLDTVTGLSDTTILGFKVNSLEQSNPTEFTVGGNCVGADGNSTSLCVATIVFKPTTVGPRTDNIKADITITLGMDALEDSLRAALDNNGIKGQIVNILYPALRTSVQSSLTDGIEGAMLDPVLVATGTGVAGPFKTTDAFIRRQFADFALRQPTATEISTWTKNLEANQAPATLTDTLRTAKTWDGTVGPVTRLYSAYFLRSPDNSGIRYWTSKSRSGTRLFAISSTFAASSEFNRRYGALSDAGFVGLVYQNVLGRSPDSAGLAYWTSKLRNGSTRGRVMVGFSESSEYVRKQSANVAVVEIWFGMLKRAPSSAELTGYAQRISSGTPTATIVTEVLASTEYRTLIEGS